MLIAILQLYMYNVYLTESDTGAGVTSRFLSRTRSRLMNDKGFNEWLGIRPCRTQWKTDQRRFMWKLSCVSLWNYRTNTRSHLFHMLSSCSSYGCFNFSLGSLKSWLRSFTKAIWMNIRPRVRRSPKESVAGITCLHEVLARAKHHPKWNLYLIPVDTIAVWSSLPRRCHDGSRPFRRTSVSSRCPPGAGARPPLPGSGLVDQTL